MIFRSYSVLAVSSGDKSLPLTAWSGKIATERRKRTIASFASLEAMTIRKTINIQLIVRMVIF